MRIQQKLQWKGANFGYFQDTWVVSILITEFVHQTLNTQRHTIAYIQIAVHSLQIEAAYFRLYVKSYPSLSILAMSMKIRPNQNIANFLLFSSS